MDILGDTIILCMMKYIGILMPNESVNNRDIMLHYRDGGLQHISGAMIHCSTHCSSHLVQMTGT